MNGLRPLLTAPPVFAFRQLSIMHYPFRRKGGISMTCTKDYREHIEYTFHAFCKVVIRNATITAARARSRKYKREISLEYLTEENHYPLSIADKYFQAPEPDEEYTLTLCGDTVIFSNALLWLQWLELYVPAKNRVQE